MTVEDLEAEVVRLRTERDDLQRRFDLQSGWNAELVRRNGELNSNVTYVAQSLRAIRDMMNDITLDPPSA